MMNDRWTYRPNETAQQQPNRILNVLYKVHNGTRIMNTWNSSMNSLFLKFMEHCIRRITSS